MLDIPEMLIILLTILLVVLWTRHWISTITPDRSQRDQKSKVRSVQAKITESYICRFVQATNSGRTKS